MESITLTTPVTETGETRGVAVEGREAQTFAQTAPCVITRVACCGGALKMKSFAMGMPDTWYAYFHVRGSFDPDDVTRRVAVTPTKIAREGETIDSTQSQWHQMRMIETP